MLADAHAARREGVKVTRVGVITPYRQQRKCLQDTFQALCADNAKEVSPTSLYMRAHTHIWVFTQACRSGNLCGACVE